MAGSQNSTTGWPFDGCEIPPGTSVVAEVYPSLWTRRFPKEDRDGDERFNLISLYSISSQLLEGYVIKDRAADLAKWSIEFETYRRAQDKLPDGEADNEMLLYHEKTSHSTDAVDSLSWRHAFLLRRFFEAVPDVELKDDQRLFSYEQQLAIYRRDEGHCKIALKCQGQKCEWDNWAADHIKPWSKGGKTTVANGQVGCIPCNSSKLDTVQEMNVLNLTV